MKNLNSVLRDSAFLFVGVLLAAQVLPGIAYEGWRDLLLAALVLSVLNTLLKPLLILFTLPFVIFTLGTGVVLINAALLYLASALVPGFQILGFWSAVFGSVMISAISLTATVLFAPKHLRVEWHWRRKRAPSFSRARRGTDVIDV